MLAKSDVAEIVLNYYDAVLALRDSISRDALNAFQGFVSRYGNYWHENAFDGHESELYEAGLLDSMSSYLSPIEYIQSEILDRLIIDYVEDQDLSGRYTLSEALQMTVGCVGKYRVGKLRENLVSNVIQSY